MKNNLLVSFSGGETSAYMAQWLWKNKQDEYNMIFVFANTGEENEETLKFVNKCEKYFNFPVVWLEAKVFHKERKGTGYKVVNFETASRKGEPFEEVIKKYGIPNTAFPHCTRELKLAPINKFAKDQFKEDYYTAIGIRSDEIDRVNKNRKELKLYYPLAEDMKMTKKHINFWWSQQPFRLNLKGYQGNCKTCHKKSDKKLYQIAKENPEYFDFQKRMEKKYGNGYVFFRKHRNADQIIKESKQFNGNVIDDSKIIDIQQELFNESCDIYSSCGD